jgi:formylmethanofuran dehydrogenase subunit B
VPVCVDCPLLCEREVSENDFACFLHQVSARRSKNLDKPIGTIDEARAILQRAKRLRIVGRVVSVEASRAILRLAQAYRAYVEIDGSEAAFRQIRAVQRAGMMTASLGEVAFRSDTIVLIGSSQLLAVFPRLLERLTERKRAISQPERPRRVILLGKWTTDDLSSIQKLACDVVSQEIDLPRIPQSLHQWLQLSKQEKTSSQNTISRWLAESSYLTMVWSPAQLNFSEPDLWIERLHQWIEKMNDESRCVGFPLASEYGTFQQVCTWTTGFPGRVQFDERDISYHPAGQCQDTRCFDVTLVVDERPVDNEVIPDSVPVIRPTDSVVAIGPSLRPSLKAQVYLPCGESGIDYGAHFFRTDGSVCLEVAPEAKTASAQTANRPAWAWLEDMGAIRG